MKCAERMSTLTICAYASDWGMPMAARRLLRPRARGGCCSAGCDTCPIRAVRDRKTALQLIAVLVEHGWLHPVEGRVLIGEKLRNEAWRIHGRTLP